MQKRTLPLSLLIAAMFTIPSLAIAAPANTKPVDMQAVAADNVIQTEAKNAGSEPVSNEFSPFEISETKTFSRAKRASTNSGNNQEALATRIEAAQNSQGMMQDPQDMQQDMQDPQQDMMQDPQDMQQDMMQDPQQDMMQDMQDPEDMQEEM